MKAIAIGADDAGFELKNKIADYLKSKGLEVEDYGVNKPDPSVLYPDVALAVAQAVAAGKHDRGILTCGTGIGVAITANKVPGIRAAVCHDSYSTERSRKSNDCNVMTMGGRVIGEELAKSMVDIWLAAEFQGGRSVPKVDRMKEIEKQFQHVVLKGLRMSQTFGRADRSKSARSEVRQSTDQRAKSVCHCGGSPQTGIHRLS